MIRTLRGTLTAHAGDGVILELGGIGYGIRTPLRSRGQLGAERRFFIHHHVREDEQLLFGFDTMEELNLFELLITVPSIGPKLAMAILSIAAPADIIGAVNTDNAGFFQAIPGLGKKSALKIIVELKGKFGGASSTSVPSGGLVLADALTGLGYDAAEVQSVVARVPAGLTDTEQVGWALRELGQA